MVAEMVDKINVSPHLRDAKRNYIEGLEKSLADLVGEEDLVAGVKKLRNRILKEKRALRRMG